MPTLKLLDEDNVAAAPSPGGGAGAAAPPRVLIRPTLCLGRKHKPATSRHPGVGGPRTLLLMELRMELRTLMVERHPTARRCSKP